MNTTTLNMTTLDGGVIIKKGTAPVPPSGGESGGNNIIYINMEGYANWVYAALFSNSVKLQMDGVIQIIPPVSYMNQSTVAPLAIAVDIDAIYYMPNGNGVLTEMRYEDIMSGFATTDVLSLPRITKEQFYSLD